LHWHKYYHHAREIWFIREKQMQTNKQKRTATVLLALISGHCITAVGKYSLQKSYPWALAQRDKW
jgi:hypothetical protein